MRRRFGLLEATALNMSNMIGIGPFITIPILMTALNGPRSLLGWLLAMLIVISDGMVWSELAAAIPGSGGTYRYLRRAFGPERWGRLAAFLFIWQFVLSGPLEIASGYIGLSNYLGYIFTRMTPLQGMLIAAGAGALNVALLYRNIGSIGKITLVLWGGSVVTALSVIIAGAFHFDSKIAFDLPNDPVAFDLGFLVGLGTAARVGVYDYLGYYDVCYIGGEVEDPGRVIPRSIIISVIVVALLYVAINLAITGTIPWREIVPAEAKRPVSDFVASIFMERIFGRSVAIVFTLMVVWTAFASVFALLLGYSRIPYAAALDGSFFKVFARVHQKGFPYVSLLVIGALSILFSFVSLSLVIDALIITRILVQFIGQAIAVIHLRRSAPDLERPYRMWLYPLPVAVALFGWLFVLVTSDPRLIGFGLVSLAAGVLCFFAWRSRAPP